MCVSSFKKGFTSLSLKTRLLDEKQHRSTHWLLLLLLAITATTIWLFAGAQWDQSSIFRPTVQFLSFFGDFWQFLAVHSGTKAQFSVPLCNFCHFLSFFAVFWQCCWPNKKGRALALKQELCLLVCPKSGTLWKICWSIWGSTGARFSQHRIFLFKSGTCPKFAAESGGALVHDFPNIEFFSSNLGLVQNLLLYLGEHWCTTFPT